MGLAGLLLVVSLPVFVALAPALNALGAGEEVAASLGHDLTRVRLLAAVLSVLVTAG